MIKETLISIPNPFPGHCYFYWETVEQQDAGLHPLELEIAQRFGSERRKAEFLTGRRCARMVMKEAGIPRLPVYRNRNRSPGWPFAIKGSIAHGGGIAAAIICRYNQPFLGVGLDVEDLSRNLKSDISHHVLTPQEKEKWLQGAESRDRQIKILFSIKEAIYKCLQPIQGISLGFHDAEIISIEVERFTATVFKNPLRRQVKLPFQLTGRVFIRDSIVLTAVLAETTVFQSQD